MFRVFTLISVITFGSSGSVPTLLLNDGLRIPIVGFGAMGATEQGVRDALAAGFRHIDTSLMYGESEKIIGKVLKDVLKEGKIKRQDLFIVSKMDQNYHPHTRVPVGNKVSLSRLGVDYLDMYLIHHPDARGTKVNFVETWLGMTDVLEANLTRSIGVSNFNEEQLDKLQAKSHIKPATNQVISNPYRNQKKLLSYLNKHNITLTAYSPVGGRHDPNLLKDPKLVEIGKRHNVSSAQVALKYQVQRNVIVITKANNPKHF